MLEFSARGNLKKLCRIMRYTILILIVTAMTVSAESYSQAKKMSINLQNSTIEGVMHFVEENSEFVFLYRNDDVDLLKEVDVNLIDASIEQILNKIFEGTDLTYDVYERQIVIQKEGKTLMFHHNRKPLREK